MLRKTEVKLYSEFGNHGKSRSMIFFLNKNDMEICFWRIMGRKKTKVCGEDHSPIERTALIPTKAIA